jgi:hypothetical protein
MYAAAIDLLFILNLLSLVNFPTVGWLHLLELCSTQRWGIRKCSIEVQGSSTRTQMDLTIPSLLQLGIHKSTIKVAGASMSLEILHETLDLIVGNDLMLFGLLKSVT